MSRTSERARRRGQIGEQRAVEYLLKSGYEILTRNFRTRRGEVDIIARDAGTIVFVEVKSWAAIDLADLEISIGKRKQRRIIDASRVYLMRADLTDRVGVRYDLIFVKGDSMAVQHVREAFTENT